MGKVDKRLLIVLLLFGALILVGLLLTPKYDPNAPTTPAPTYQPVLQPAAAAPTTGEQLSARIKSACRDEYGDLDQDEVTKCVFVHEVKAMEQIRKDRESAVDARIGR